MVSGTWGPRSTLPASSGHGIITACRHGMGISWPLLILPWRVPSSGTGKWEKSILMRMYKLP